MLVNSNYILNESIGGAYQKKKKKILQYMYVAYIYMCVCVCERVGVLGSTERFHILVKIYALVFIVCKF